VGFDLDASGAGAQDEESAEPGDADGAGEAGGVGGACSRGG